MFVHGQEFISQLSFRIFFGVGGGGDIATRGLNNSEDGRERTMNLYAEPQKHCYST